MPVDLIAAIQTANKVRKFFSSDGMLDSLAGIDMEAAADCFRKAKISHYPLEHYLSARNHLESFVAKKSASSKATISSLNRNGINAMQDAVYALALMSIIDFCITDLPACNDDLDRIEGFDRKIRHAQTQSSQAGGTSGRGNIFELFAIPAMIYQIFNPPSRVDDPMKFCTQMRSFITTT